MKKILTVCTVLLMITTASCNKANSDQEISNSVSENPSLSQTSNNSSADNTTNSSDDIIITMPRISMLEDVQVVYEDGSYGPYAVIDDVVEKFNNTDNGYKIVYKDYSEYYDSSKDIDGGPSQESYSRINLQLSLDVMQGGILDIIPKRTFTNSGTFISLAEKGAFVNLYDFMENDAEINTDTLYKHILDLFEIDGNLYYLPLNFKIDTLAGYSKYVGTEENWNMDDLKECWSIMPENATFNGKSTRDYVYMNLLRGELTTFIDYDNCTCSFDSSEFIDILEFCNSFPEPLSYKTDTDWDSPTFVFPFKVSTFDKFHEELWNEQDDPITFVGYPSNDESGTFIDSIGTTYAISSSASPEVQEGAWQFLRMLASYDTQYAMSSSYFPINLAAFEARANESISKYGQENIISSQGVETDIGYLSQDEYNRLVALIDGTKKASLEIDDDVFEIIEDEIWAMFDGEKTPELTAKDIQNRVSILVSEKY